MTDTPVSLDQLRARLDLKSRRRAAALMRQMRHVRQGREMWTTEGWLAVWLAERSVGAAFKRKATYDPLEEAVVERVVHLVGELAARGAIRVRSA